MTEPKVDVERLKMECTGRPAQPWLPVTPTADTTGGIGRPALPWIFPPAPEE